MLILDQVEKESTKVQITKVGKKVDDLILITFRECDVL